MDYQKEKIQHKTRILGTYPGGYRKAFGVLLVLIITTLTAAVTANAAMLSGEYVIIQGLDKVTARVSTFEAPIDTVVKFGALRLVVRKCESTPPEEPPESRAFIDIYEIRRDEPTIGLFHGWMFASSPALSALEHPVYDVWILNCRTRTPVDIAK